MWRLRLILFMGNKISVENCYRPLRPTPHPSFHSIFLLFIGLWVRIGHRSKSACYEFNVNWILCKTADLNQWPVLERKICSDSNWIAQPLQMEVSKSLENISGMVSELITTQGCCQICGKWKSHVKTCQPCHLEISESTTAESNGIVLWRFFI